MGGLLFDITRTIMRAAHAAPTGVDRVERAYFKWVLEQTDRPVAFICRLKGAQAMFDRAAGAAIFDAPAFRPKGPDYVESRAAWLARRNAVQVKAFLRCQQWFRTPAGAHRAFQKLGLDPSTTTLLNVSHNNLTADAGLVLRELGLGRLIVFIHDLIPWDYPEYFTARGQVRFQEQMRVVAEHADALIFNSQFTADRAFARLGELTERRPPHLVAHLGLERFWTQTEQPPPPPSDKPYFVVLGTIEPRKNHLMLLHVWRQLADRMETPPDLHVIGWRGWENENVLDMLERSHISGSCVFEHRALADEKVLAWVSGARATLFPSFVEGFGIPVAESLAVGAPVICSDIPVLREVGGDAPEYIDPINGAAWASAVADYAQPNSIARQAQLARLRRYEAPTWDAHMAKVDVFVKDLDSGAADTPPLRRNVTPRPARSTVA